MSGMDFRYLEWLQGVSSPGLEQLQILVIYLAAVGAAIVLAAIVLAVAIGLAGGSGPPSFASSSDSAP